MGHLFKYLGLAVFEKENLLGWEPTQDTMDCVVTRILSPSKPKRSWIVNHPIVLTLLRRAALRQTGLVDHDPWLAFGVLEALEFVYLDRDGEEYLATTKLLYLCDHALDREWQNEQSRPIQMH